jgi:hypothetical protein
MKKLLVILFSLISLVTYSQSGVGYLNYTVYNIRNNGAGAYANSATDFVNMFDTTKGATVYARGVGAASRALYFNGNWNASGVPNGGAYTGIKIEGYFVPKESGTYTFGIDGDDGVDFSLNGSVVTSFYGPHGFGGYRYGSITLVAGTTYTFMARYQNWGGGWGMYLVWKRPSQGSYTTQTDEVTNVSSTPSKKGMMNFDFGSTLDKTKFSINSALSSAGWIDVTNSIDSVKIANGNKGTIVSGQVEWSYVNTTNSTNTLYIDLRKFGNTTPSSITQVKILDVYEGPVIYVGSNIYWAYYTVPTSLPKLTDGSSTFASNIRNAGYDNYAFSCDVSFASVMEYKPQSVTVTTTNTLSTLYNSIVTVSDVYLAFKEYSDAGGLFGGGSGTQFTYGIQYKNADINDDGVFDESDCFRLLQHLTGAKNIVDTFNLRNTLKMIPTTTYNTIGKSNWNTFSSYLGDTYNFDINTGKATDTFYLSGTWKGDVNLSHSATPTSNGIANMSIRMSAAFVIPTSADIISQLVGDSLYVDIAFNPGDNSIVGTQFQLNYDNTLLKYNKTEYKINGSPTNYSVDKTAFVNLGSLNSDGSQITSATYKVLFTTTQKLSNALGLVSIGATEAVNKEGKSMVIKIQ